MTTTGQRVLDYLKAYDLQDSGGDQYRANSPLRPGSNSHGFTLTVSADGEHGAFQCKVTGESGSLYALAERLDIPTPDGITPVQDTKRAYRDLADYAKAHGSTADVFRAAHWADVQQKYDAKLKRERPALAFKTANGTRYRFIDGEKPTYKSETGFKACWYGLDRALILHENFLPLVLCNGEASTIVAQALGIPACCVSGGEQVYPAALVAELKSRYQDKVLIALDCDDTGRKAAQAIKAQLVGMDATVIDLGLGDKGDLADFCMLHGADTAEKLLHRQSVTPAQETPYVASGSDTAPLSAALTALTAHLKQEAKAQKAADLTLLLAQAQSEIDRLTMKTAAPTILSFSDLSRDNLTQLDWVLANPDPIQGLRSRIPSLDKAVGGFLPEVYVIYGATSMGKSWLAVSLCREFITQGTGLIVTTESNPKRWQTRLVASLTHIDAERIETGMLSPDEQKQVRASYDYLATLHCHAVANGSPTPAQVRAAFLAGADKYDYKWLLVDSGSKMSAPGATSIYDKTTAVSDGLQSLYQEVNVPIIVTSQVGRDVASRDNKMPQLEDAYGGGVIEHNAGVVIGLYRHQYYVEKGTANINADFPPNMTLARLLKNRWRPGSQVNTVKLAFVGASGFYEMGRETA